MNNKLFEMGEKPMKHFYLSGICINHGNIEMDMNKKKKSIPF